MMSFAVDGGSARLWLHAETWLVTVWLSSSKRRGADDGAPHPAGLW